MWYLRGAAGGICKSGILGMNQDWGNKSGDHQQEGSIETEGRNTAGKET